MAIDARGGQSSLVKLEGVSALWQLLGRANNLVELDCHLIDLDWLENSGNEHTVCIRGGGGLSDMVTGFFGVGVNRVRVMEASWTHCNDGSLGEGARP